MKKGKTVINKLIIRFKIKDVIIIRKEELEEVNFKGKTYSRVTGTKKFRREKSKGPDIAKAISVIRECNGLD